MRWLLTVFLLSMFIPHLDNFPGGNNVKYIFTAIATLAIPLGSRRVAVLPDRPYEHICFSILLGGALISLLINRDPGSILYVFFMPVSYLLYNYIRSYGLTRQQVFLLSGFIILTCAVPKFWYGKALMGIYGNPNLLSPLVGFALYLLLCTKRALPGWFKFGVFLVTTVIVILTNSRAGQLGYFIFIGAYFVQAIILKRHLKFLSYFGIIAAIGVYLWMLNTKALFIIEAANNLTGSEKAANFSERDELFELFFAEVERNPYGVGLGQSQKFTAEHTSNSFSPHNTYLKIAAEGGWTYSLGFVLLFTLLFFKNQSIATSAYMMGFCIRGLFESATPFTISMTSALLFLPFYLNEFNILHPRKTVSADEPGQPTLDQMGERA